MRIIPRTVLEMAVTLVALGGLVWAKPWGDHAYDQHAGMWIHPVVLSLTLAYWRFRILEIPAPSNRLLAFGALLLAGLPYLYSQGALLADSYRLPISKWIGDPFWIYTVPATSFILLDLKPSARSPRSYWRITCLELLVGLPVWTALWLFLQGVMNWYQMG